MLCESVDSIDEDEGIVTYNPVQTETWKDCDLSSVLDQSDRADFIKLLEKHHVLFFDKPGRTKTTTFKIDTGDANHIAQRPYQLAHSLKQPVEEEIKTLLEQGIITESTSEWSSPMAVRRKENNGKYEFTCLPFAGLTAKPSKCKIGHAQVPYLGHLVGHGTVRPLQAKVETIQNFPLIFC